MPKQNPDPDAALRKLGHHVRLGWKKTSPMSGKAIEAVRDVIRQKWEREQAKRPTPNADGTYTCPTCRKHFAIEEVMYIAADDSLRGDPVLGADAAQRFFATRFNDHGQALDAKGSPCSDIACPHCHTQLPQGYVEALKAKGKTRPARRAGGKKTTR